MSTGTIVRIVILVIAIGACGFFALMMPWAENQMENTKDAMPHTLKLLKLDEAAEKAFTPYAPKKDTYTQTLDSKKAEGKYGEYVYAWALGLALLAGAIGIMAIGSEDEQEKTLLPQKQ